MNLRQRLVQKASRAVVARIDLRGPGLLLTRNCERTLEIGFSFRGVRLRRHQRDLASYAIDFGLPTTFLAAFLCSDGLANTVRGLIPFALIAPEPRHSHCRAQVQKDLSLRLRGQLDSAFVALVCGNPAVIRTRAFS